MALQLALGQANEPTTTVAAAATVNQQIEELAPLFGVNTNTAEAIIKCESGDNPNAVRLDKTSGGIVWSRDIGTWQLNTVYQAPVMAELGLSVYNHEDNLLYGLYLLSKEGTKPWAWSRGCWLPLTR